MSARPCLLAALILLLPLAAGAADETLENTDKESTGRLTEAERARYAGLSVLMSESERAEYLSLEKKIDRKAWVEAFWKEKDLTVTTATNERRTEHEERVKLARELFPAGSGKGWDARGDAFIRWGFPAARRKIWGNVSDSNVRLPGESWGYAAPDTVVDFIDLYLSGEYLLVTSYTGRDPWSVRDSGGLFPAPREGDPVALRRQASRDGVDFEIDRYASSDLLRGMVDEVCEKYGLEPFQPKGDENSFFLYPDLDLNMLSFFDILCFRAGEGKIRTEINLEVPLTELGLKQEGESLRGEVEMRVLLFDTEGEQAGSSIERFSVVARGDAQRTAAGSLLGQTVLSLDPAPYRIWIEVIDLNGSRRSELKTRKWAHSLDGGLVISDIQFAKKVVESDRPNRYMKNNFVVVPHPLHLYRRPFPVTLYFEIYGLDTDDEDHTFYSIEYEVEPVWDDSPGPTIKKKPETISSSFDTGGFGSTQPARILIATDDLEQGPYTLTVTVMDRRTREKVSRKSRFSILE